MADLICDVLIVEDERLQCEEMAGFLARAGLSVVMAHDDTSGIAQARRYTPRVVALLDFNLPDMTGLQVAELLRGFLPETAMLIASGRIEGLSEQTLKTFGITAFVNKPLPLGPLRQAVLRLARTPPVNRIKQQHQAARSGGWLATGFGATLH